MIDDLPAHHRDLATGATGLLAEFNRRGVITAADVHTATTLGRLGGESTDDVLLAVALAVRAVRLGSSVADLDDSRALLSAEAPDLPWPGDGWLDRVARSPLASGPDGVLAVDGSQVQLVRYRDLETSLVERLAERVRASPPGWTRVITGGPGTGKTTMIAQLLDEIGPASVGLAAPTGKAAARMREALGRDAVTVHRLLGPRPGHRTAFRHHAGQRLPYDVVVIDETSMVSLLMMERLVQAVAPTCRLILVGDADQLASVEAGAVLRDIIDGLEGAGVDAVTRLTESHRFAGAIGELASAVVAGDAESALATLRSGEGVTLVDPAGIDDVIGGRPLAQARSVASAALHGDGDAALRLLAEHRLLCAHREGPWGVAGWNERLEREVRTFADAQQPWYAGRPVLATRNDAALGVNNGDVGITVERDGHLAVVLDTGREVASSRLVAAQSAYASTVHRSQGSEFEHVTLVLPDDDSLVLTRELIYTAVTRARTSLTVVGSPDVIARAIERRTARASGVAARLAASLR